MSTRQSIRELRRICQDPVIQGNVWYARNFARKISIYFTKLLLYTRITANQTTFLFILIGIVAGLLFIFGDCWHALGGAIVLQLWYIFDHVDGEIARYRKQTSLTGVYLDRMSHFIVHPLVFMGITLGVYKNIPRLDVLVFGFLASIFLGIFDLVHGYGQGIPLYAEITKFIRQGNLASENLPKRHKENEEKSLLNTSKGSNIGKPSNLLRMLWRIFLRISFFWHYPSMMNVICVVAIFSLFLPISKIGSFEFSPMYLVILIYGITLPILSLLLLFKQVILRDVDNSYREIITLLTQI